MATLPDRALVVVDAPVTDLRGWDRNPRRVKPARLEQLKRMLAEAPEMLRARPLIALMDGTVIAGNQRLAAAAELGWDSIPTVYADLDEATAIEWAFRDNNSVGESDDDLAAELLSELSERGRVLDMTGFAPVEVSALLRRVAPPVDPDAVPALPTAPRSVRGEVYELGPHRLMCGDATNRRDVDLLCAGNADLVWTDPPYGIAFEALRRDDLLENDGDLGTAEIALKLALGLCTAEAHFVCCNWRSLASTERAMTSAGVPPKACIVWDKEHGVQNLDRFAKQHEFVLYAGPYGGTRTVDGDVWRIARDYAPDHPTPKPVELVTRSLSAAGWDLIYDPFGGSGSTIIAADQTERHAVVMEIDPAYCDVTRQRYADYVQDQRWAP